MEFAAACGHNSNAPAAECTWGASGEVGEKSITRLQQQLYNICCD